MWGPKTGWTDASTVRKFLIYVLDIRFLANVYYFADTESSTLLFRVTIFFYVHLKNFITIWKQILIKIFLCISYKNLNSGINFFINFCGKVKVEKSDCLWVCFSVLNLYENTMIYFIVDVKVKHCSMVGVLKEINFREKDFRKK